MFIQCRSSLSERGHRALASLPLGTLEQYLRATLPRTTVAAALAGCPRLSS